MKRIHGVLSGILFLSSFSALAAVLVEFKQGDGSTNTMYFQGMKVRVDSSAEPGYIIIDLKQNKIIAVSHEEKKIIDMGNIEHDETVRHSQPLNIEFVKKGNGPSIIGYATKHYEVRVNGKKCSDEYLNKTMPKNLGIEAVLAKMPSADSGMEMMQDMAMQMNPCLLAEPGISAMFSRYGYPLRSVNANGELDTEVIRVNKKASLPAGGFSYPKAYQRVDAGKMMHDLQQKMQNMPELTEEGMQNATPEQLQQMQQMMEQMMKKMGQPGE